MPLAPSCSFSLSPVPIEIQASCVSFWSRTFTLCATSRTLNMNDQNGSICSKEQRSRRSTHRFCERSGPSRKLIRYPEVPPPSHIFCHGSSLDHTALPLRCRERRDRGPIGPVTSSDWSRDGECDASSDVLLKDSWAASQQAAFPLRAGRHLGSQGWSLSSNVWMMDNF
jgi:hypothetical protein